MKRHYIPVTADVPGVSDSTKSFLRKVIRTALDQQGVDVPCEVDVYVTGDAGIQELNREMRQVDRPTDVLSFPEFELMPGQLPGQEDADPGTGYVPLGDMAISLERVKAQAKEYGHSNRRELAYLLSTPCCTCWATTTWTRARRRRRCGRVRRPSWPHWALNGNKYTKSSNERKLRIT